MNEKIRLTPQEKTRLPEPDSQNVTRFCPKCGREIPLDQSAYVFCRNTGAMHPAAQPRGKKILIAALMALIFLFLLALALFLTRNTGLVS